MQSMRDIHTIWAWSLWSISSSTGLLPVHRCQRVIDTRGRYVPRETLL